MALMGKLVLKTAVDTKQLESQLANEQKKLEKYEKQNEILIEAKVKVEKTQAMQEYTKAAKELKDRFDAEVTSIKQRYVEKVYDAEMGQSMLNKVTDRYKENVSELKDKYSDILTKVNQIDDKIKRNTNNQQKTNDKIDEYKEKLEEAKNKKEELARQPSDNNGTNGLGGIIKKITKIGLGLVGLRTGIALLRSSISTLAGQNDAISTQINTMKAAIANGLAPVVEFVINLFRTLLAYIGYIYRAWTGINIFAKDTAKNTKKTKNNLSGANKEATKLKRTLAGFDEMNILQKDGGVSSGGGGGGVANDIDMSMFDNIAIPEWVQWIADHKETILTILKDIGIAIGVAFGVAKIIEFVSWIQKLEATSKALLALKIGAFLVGEAIAIAGIIELVKLANDETATLNDWLKALGVTITGVGIALVALNASNPIGWISILIGGVMALVGAFTDEEKKVKDLKVAQYDLLEAQEALSRASNELIAATDAQEKAQANLKKTAKELNMSQEDLMKSGEHLYQLVADGEIKYSSLNETDRKVYQTYVNMISAEQRLEKATKELNEANVTATQENLELARTTAFSSKNFDEYGKSIAKAMENGSITAHEAGERIYEALQEMDEASRQTFVDNLPNDAKLGMLTFRNNLDNAMDGLSDKLPKVEIKFTANTSSMSSVFNNAIKTIQNKLSLLKFPTIKSAKGSVIYPLAKGGILNLPKLAPGGLINRPGPGVAIGGEKGTEAVVPLTDSQQMARLGMAIGKYVNIRAEIPVSIGNRQVAREIRNINADEEFAYNG